MSYIYIHTHISYAMYLFKSIQSQVLGTIKCEWHFKMQRISQYWKKQGLYGVFKFPVTEKK